MITRVHFQNLKVIREADLELERLTVLVGPNASGKTSILDGIRQLAELKATGDFDHIRTTLAPVLRSQNANGPFVACLEANWGNQSGRIELTLRDGVVDPSSGIRDVVLTVTASSNDSDEGTCKFERSLRDHNGDPAAVLRMPVWKAFNPCVILELDAKELARPYVPGQAVPRMTPNGFGLAAALADLAATDPNLRPQVADALRAVVPGVRDIRLQRASIPPTNVQGYELLFDMSNGAQVPAAAASEGTLLVLGYITALMTMGPPRVLLVESMERGLHPQALGKLIAQLRGLLQRFPDVQIIATSHSPYLLDHLRPEEIRITSLAPDGTARAGSLIDHPDFERWKDEMSPGEFWSSVGEAWVGETAPSANVG